MVLYRESGDPHPANLPLFFPCQADDADHAEEQCLNAYPDCTVAWIYQGKDKEGALRNYLGVTPDEAMTHDELAELAINILQEADIIQEFDDSYFVKVDKEYFDRFMEGDK
jgi:hypothetical protein